MSGLEENLRIEEYKYVREMVKNNIDIMEKNESLILLSAAAVYAFLLKDFDGDRNVMRLAFSIPLALSIFGFMRYRALDELIGVYNDFLQQREVENPFLSWTTFYRTNASAPGRSLLKRTRDAFWWSLILVSAAVFIAVNVPAFLEFICR